MGKNPHYPDGSRVFCIYGAHVVPPASTDDHDVLLVEDTEAAARAADACGAIYGYTFKNGVADDEVFIGLTRQADNYEPPDPDGEEMFRDHQAEARDQMEAARRLK